MNEIPGSHFTSHSSALKRLGLFVPSSHCESGSRSKAHIPKSQCGLNCGRWRTEVPTAHAARMSAADGSYKFSSRTCSQKKRAASSKVMTVSHR